MRNLFYFLKHYGNKSFKEFPLNEVDSLLLCQLSYLYFERFVPTLRDNKEGVLFSQINDPFNVLKICRDTLDEKNNIKLLNRLFKCSRYKNMRLNFYRSLLDAKTTKQFSATTFIFEDFVYVAYRGTDPTLIGWKEDFYLSTDEKIPAQIEASDYLNAIAQKTPLPIYVGGHSKGGNLSFYAAIYCDKDVQDRLITVYNHDGPGFHVNLFDTEEFKRIQSRTHKSVPKNDIVGILMHHTMPDSVVLCKGIGILQHDPYNWKVNKHGSFKTVRHIAHHSKVMDLTLKACLDSLTKPERLYFIEILFSVLGANTAVTTVDMMRHPFLYASEVRKRYRELSKDDKLIIKNFIKSFRVNYRIYYKQLRVMKNIKNGSKVFKLDEQGS